MGFTFAEILHQHLGHLSFAAGDPGLCCVSFQRLVELKNRTPFQDTEPSLESLDVIKAVLKAVDRYFNGETEAFDIKIDWQGMSSFQKQVLEITKSIPYGSLMSYGDIANRLNKPGAARSVGRAMGSNPMPIIIPCHRVVGSEGKLRGFSGGINKKKFLLELEGHQIEGDRVILNSGFK